MELTSECSELSELEEIEQQCAMAVNHRTHKKFRKKFRNWGLSPNIARASASRAKPELFLEQPAELPVPVDPIAAPESPLATCYTELIAGIDAKRVALGIRHLDFEVLIGVTQGHWGKAAGMLQVKRLGIEKIFDALRGAGLRIRLEEDPEQTRNIQNQIANKGFVPRQANQARPGNSANLSNKVIDGVLDYLAHKKGGLARLNKAVKEARSNGARHASNAGWKRKPWQPVDRSQSRRSMLSAHQTV